VVLRLRKRYGRQTAVDGVSFTVDRGQVVGLLGPNGAGKTSVIKMLLGLVRPDAGEVLLLGPPGARPAARARVGYLPELFRYQPWLTAAEVLALHVRLAGADVPAEDRRESLRAVGLAARAATASGGFSKGMQQRLGLAVALVARPALVVLDEPTSALDPVGRADVRDLLLELKARGVAVLLNSHLIGEVERVCDRVVILDKGPRRRLGHAGRAARPPRAADAPGGRGRARPGPARAGRQPHPRRSTYVVELAAEQDPRTVPGPRRRPRRPGGARAHRRAEPDQPGGAPASGSCAPRAGASTVTASTARSCWCWPP
jgi:ABC-2 type transport system ATP-binding protein